MGNYSIATTITVPANAPVQIIGDGGGCQFGSMLSWTGSSGPVIELQGPSRATLRDFAVISDGNTGIEVDGADQTGGSVYTEELNVSGESSSQTGIASFYDNGAEDADINLICPFLGSPFISYLGEVVGGPKLSSGETANGYVQVASGSAEDSGTSAFNVLDGGQLSVQALYIEVDPNWPIYQALNLQGSGKLTLNEVRFDFDDLNNSYTTPTYYLNNFDGELTKFANYECNCDYSSATGNSHWWQIQGNGANTNVFEALGQFQSMNNNVPYPLSTYWQDSTSPAGNDAVFGDDVVVGSLLALNKSEYQGVVGNIPNATYILDRLALLRSTSFAPPTQPAGGLTAVRMYRVTATPGANAYGLSINGAGSTTCAPPSFNPGPGTYSSAQSVTISTASSGASINYTTNGTTPSSSVGTLYSSPVSISSTCTLQAIAYESGYTPSGVSSGVYTISANTCAAPTFNPAAGTYGSSPSVTISTTTSGASINYTTNGTTPSSSVGTLYSSPVAISSTCTLQAIAFETGWTPSSVSSGVYTINASGQTIISLNSYYNLIGITPSSDESSGNYDGAGYSYAAELLTANPSYNSVSYQLGPMTAGAENDVQCLGQTITLPQGQYTAIDFLGSGTNGNQTANFQINYSDSTNSTPSITETNWCSTGSNTVETMSYRHSGSGNNSQTNYIFAYSLTPTSGKTVSSLLLPNNTNMHVLAITLVGSGTGTCAAPTFNPAAGAYGPAQSVTISTTTGGASINYTTNGTTPSSSVGTLYSTPVSISSTCTLEAIAYETGWTPSSVSSGVYTINGACAAPTFNPAAGTYASAQSVTISTTTSGASINYTTNGTTPSSSVGTLYSTPVSISSTCTLEAIAFETGWTPSSVSSGVYTINGSCAAPTFNPAAGTYSSAQSVTISTTTGGASINYTTNGTTPSSSVGTLYSSPVAISSTCTLQAIAYKTGYSNSTVSSGVYTITGTCAAPTFTPAAGAYGPAQSVTISTTTGGASINYTTNGTTPSSSVGTLYSIPVSISSTCTLEAIAFETGWTPSSVSSGVYTINGACAASTFNPAAGTYSSAQSVTISTTTGGASINYTTNGTTPSSSVGTLYSSPVTIGSTCTLQAIAYKTGYSNSTVTSGVYTITGTCAAPTFTPAAGAYGPAQSVTISTTTGGASINYTTNGTTPSSSVGTLYSTPVSISSTCTLEAIAFETGWTPSSVTSGVYTINGACAAPTFNPAAGTYSSAQSVTISTTTSGASINYTTNGTTPSSSVGTLYSSPVAISSTCTLEAIAYETGYSNSTVSSGVYTITGTCAAPTFNPAAGTYGSAQSVTISTTTGGASINYTTNGTTPSSSVGTLYSTPVSISSTCTLEAIAFETGWTPSAVTSGTYTISGSGQTIVSLSSYYNVIGITPSSNETSGNYDGAGYSYAAELLTANPSYNSVSYQLGPMTAGAENDVQCVGQTITLPQGQYTAINFLGSGTNGSQTANFQINYSNSTNSITGITETDWCDGGSNEVETLSYRHSGSGNFSGTNYIYAYSLTPTAGLTVTSLQLPNNADMNVLAITLVGSGTQVAAPTFTPAAGTYASAQSVTISTTTGGASINYTTNGTTPSSSVGTLYSSPVAIGSTGTLQAIAFETGWTPSSVSSGVYTITGTCAAPTFTPAAGTFNNATSVTISTTTGGASIRYTTNGTTPTSSVGTAYSSPVSITATCTLEAIAYETGWTSSSVSSGVYTLSCAAPTFNPAAGTFNNATSVTISTTSSGASIRYTTNGTTPTSSVGTVYSSPVSLTATSTLKAIAYETGYTASAVTSGVYTLACAAPTFNPAAGTFNNATSVTISTTTSGASIRYTTNGTTPTSSVGTVYSSPVSISSTGTLEAIAYETGYTSSAVTSGVYTLACAAPTFNPAAGSYSSAQTVTISTTSSGASIRYTTNGTTPTSSVGTVYSSPVSISTTGTLEAIAYETGWTSSAVSSGTYTISGSGQTIVSLSSYFNVIGITPSSDETSGNYDGAGYSYAAELLNATPTYNSVSYQLGPMTAGAENDVQCVGQTITLPQGQYTTIYFLASATNGSQTGTFQINYSDTTNSTTGITETDWCNSGSNIVETMSYRHSGSGNNSQTNYIFAYSLTPTAGKTVTSLLLPNNADMNVLAITLSH